MLEGISKYQLVLSQYEWKLHEPGFDEEYSVFMDKRKQTTLQWLQNPSQINADNINNQDIKLVDISGTKRIFER